MARFPVALTIAGSDSGGGAGIQADLKTFSAFRVYGASVIAALTAQNTKEVRAIHSVPAGFVRAQLETVLDDIRVDAVKIGMLSDPGVIEAVSDVLAQRRLPNIVVDPVMVAKCGAKLLCDEAVSALVTCLFPLADVITPNLFEAEVLLKLPRAAIEENLRAACEALLALGAKAVVLKGGHFSGKSSDDILLDRFRFKVYPGPRIPTKNTHGTGCTYSSAIAALLARGESLEQAVAGAKEYIQQAIARSAELEVGTGHGPVHHFFQYW